jgi:hypothetical protein
MVKLSDLFSQENVLFILKIDVTLCMIFPKIYTFTKKITCEIVYFFYCNLISWYTIFAYDIYLKYTLFSYDLPIKNTKKYTFFAYDLYYNYLGSCRDHYLISRDTIFL